jgi:hypothetical protein
MSAAIEATKPDAKAEQIRAKFKQLLDKTNKEHPSAKDVKGLADLLNGHKGLELWRDVLSAAQFAERTVIENSACSPGSKRMLEASVIVVKERAWLCGSPDS